jgi:hypothetical protein
MPNHYHLSIGFDTTNPGTLTWAAVLDNGTPVTSPTVFNQMNAGDSLEACIYNRTTNPTSVTVALPSNWFSPSPAGPPSLLNPAFTNVTLPAQSQNLHSAAWGATYPAWPVVPSANSQNAAQATVAALQQGNSSETFAVTLNVTVNGTNYTVDPQMVITTTPPDPPA